MSLVKSQREQTDAAEELDNNTVSIQRGYPSCSSQSARPIGPHTLFKASTASTAGGT
jgi:hypothetical protein